MQTAKHDLMRSTNTLSILECVRGFGPLTKREIREKTGLSWGAVSTITGELVRKRILCEYRSSGSSVGRTPYKLDINRDEHLIVGVDINVEGITAVLIDMKCRVLKEIKTGVDGTDRERTLLQVKQVIRQLIGDLRAGVVVGIGIAMQGAVNIEKGISVFSPYFSDWMDVPVRDIIGEEFKLPVYLEHDPNCMALTERWLGYAMDIRNLLFIRLSVGIGMSIVIDGEIYRGSDGSAGEFGHIIMDQDGPQCTCGNNGCLEAYASGRSLLKEAGEGIALGKAPVAARLAERNRGTDLGTVVAAARQGDGYIRDLFQKAGLYLGIGISNLVSIFNPEIIILGGELAKCTDLFLDRTCSVVKQKAWRNSRVNIVVSKFESDSAAIGAAAVFVQKVFHGEMDRFLC